MENKITKEEFDLFCSETLSVKEHRKLNHRIDSRFASIIEFMATPKFKWVDYDNEGGDEDSPGHFSIGSYKEKIGFTGDFKLPQPYEDDMEIPTRWLWEDFEEEFKREVANEKQRREEAEQEARQAAIDAKNNKVVKFLVKHNITVKRVFDDLEDTSHIAIVFNNKNINEDYVMEFLKRNLK